MKYWFYSDGNILGPYDPAEMLGMPAFNEESLVCAETANGDNADDWKAASQVSEIASLMGSGRAVTASVAAGAYRLENSMDSGSMGFDEKEPGAGSSYNDLLDTIDNILGTRKMEPDPTRPQPADYELAEKFDIRLSRIQEELEAARWEKNLLLEKMRIREMEDKKNRARINELEARLKGEMRSAELNAKELEQVRHLTDITERSETIKKIEEIKREELSLEKYLVPERDNEPGARPGPEGAKTLDAKPKTLKSIAPSAPLGVKRMDGLDAEPTPGTGVAGHKLKSLGQTQPPAYVYGAKPQAAQPAGEPEPKPAPRQQAAPETYEVSHRNTPLPGPEAAPAGAYRGFENLEPLPQQAGGVVYDFTVVTAKPEGTSQQFKIESWPGQAAAPAPAYAPAPAPAPAPVPARTQQSQPPSHAAQPMEFVPVSAPAPSFQQPQVYNPSAPLGSQAQGVSFSPAPSGDYQPADLNRATVAPAAGPDQTQRSSKASPEGAPVKDGSVQPATKAKGAAVKPVKKGGKMAFVGVILIFGCIAVGGLGYFFLGDGISFSEFSMMNLGGGKKPARAAATAQLEEPAASPEPAGVQQQPAETQPAPAAETAPAPAETQQEPVPQAEKPSNENIRKALEIVKSYKLAGGRGSIESWFSNSFLSGGAGGANEEWTATPLHGDILVVQYRLIRPKQDPMIYQFEVDAAKGDIVRGINNNAIELLDASREKTASAAPVKKTAKPAVKPQPRVRKPVKPRELAILPLPDAPAAGGNAEADPTGFEQPESNDKVKYLKAQESDEELF
ncbi:MAG TPA: hypothetical protein PKI19_13540 [Elusimicrobiales bacterium]|nr:hypothetical protein [Elusimicrobiales bacterium]